MPTNTLNGVNPTRISQLTLETLATMPLDFSWLTTDLSPDVARSGDSVVTRYVTNPVAQDLNASKAASNSATTSRTITLFHYMGVAIGFSDKEMAFSDIKLTEQFIKPALTAMFVNVWDNVAGLVTATAFSQNTICNATNFNAANVANVGTNLTKANVATFDRHLVINPDMALTLKKDTSLSAAYAYGGNQVITEGMVPRVYGFNVHEFNGVIPTNSCNLIGWASRPQALLLATRVPETPRNWYGTVTNITDPRSGLTIQFRDYYDGNQQKTEFGIIYGAQIGNPGNLWRITST